MPDQYAVLRESMVTSQIIRRGVDEPRVLEAMRAVPRHLFVPENYRDQAYDDSPLPIGHEQTISQPYMVALMAQLLDARQNDSILDVGTGSGYQAAVVSQLVRKVVSVELVAELSNQAAKVLDSCGFRNISLHVSDGTKGWTPNAPYDGIVVAATGAHIPPALITQLKIGGRLIIPLVVEQAPYQMLTRVTKEDDENVVLEDIVPVRFVPLVGS